ncbi:MAG: phytanoyl-CoA dioxygenase family protein [Pseudomonadales bacterium]
MPNNIKALITPKLIEQFFEEGVVFLSAVVEPHWIDKLRIGVDKNVTSPSPRGRVWDKDEQGNVCLFDAQAWTEIEEYREFVEDGPLAEIAGRLMNVSEVNFFYDAIFARTPGNQFRTPFHQDEPYWSVEGFNTCSIWMPLMPVEKRSALEFVKGSHRWSQKYKQTNFGALTGHEADQVVFDDKDTVPFPDIERNREQYDMLSWDMQPGDIAVFNSRMIHGGSGNLAPGRSLRVFNTQWLADDVRINFRPEGMDPDHSAVMTEHGLGHGDRVGGPLYPVLWTRHENERMPR